MAIIRLLILGLIIPLISGAFVLAENSDPESPIKVASVEYNHTSDIATLSYFHYGNYGGGYVNGHLKGVGYGYITGVSEGGEKLATFLPHPEGGLIRSLIVSDSGYLYSCYNYRQELRSEVFRYNPKDGSTEIIDRQSGTCRVNAVVTSGESDFVILNVQGTQQGPKRLFRKPKQKLGPGLTSILAVSSQTEIEQLSFYTDQYINFGPPVVIPQVGFVRLLRSPGPVDDVTEVVAVGARLSDLAQGEFPLFATVDEAIDYLVQDQNVTESTKTTYHRIAQRLMDKVYVRKNSDDDLINPDVPLFATTTDAQVATYLEAASKTLDGFAYDLAGGAMVTSTGVQNANSIPYAYFESAGDTPYEQKATGRINASDVHEFIGR